MVEDDYRQQVCDAGNQAMNMMCSLIKAEMAINFEQYSLAARIYDEIRSSSEEAIHSNYSAPIYYWNAARAHYKLYEDSGKRNHLRNGRRYKKLLLRMESTGCPNAIPLVSFLEAQEFARGKSNSADALRDTYNTGIACLAEHKFVLYEATLNEKAGFDFAARGMLELAKGYFERALLIYKYELGATAKHNWLVEKSQLSLMVAGQDVGQSGPHGTFVTVLP